MRDTSAASSGVVIIDKPYPVEARTDENLLRLLAMFARDGRDVIVGYRRCDIEAEAQKRGLL